MCQYIKFCYDLLVTALQQPHIYSVANPFPWMALTSIYDCEYPTSGIVIDTAHLPGLLCFSNELISLDEIMH
jgi:hypothetical protein